MSTDFREVAINFRKLWNEAEDDLQEANDLLVKLWNDGVRTPEMFEHFKTFSKTNFVDHSAGT